jgi:hypothetical protein
MHYLNCTVSLALKAEAALGNISDFSEDLTPRSTTLMFEAGQLVNTAKSSLMKAACD